MGYMLFLIIQDETHEESVWNFHDISDWSNFSLISKYYGNAAYAQSDAYYYTITQIKQ